MNPVTRVATPIGQRALAPVMSNTPLHDVDQRAYPEPPASPLWHRNGPKAQPLTAAQQRHNRELLVLAQRTPRPRSPRTTDTLAEAS
ncbi:hypothetical protein [Streptomyces sp. H39-C1]|uniref:hypothetical protein n=1 Tax=Streptomyces sp. H39-C1 TaxID=3004355 RepID=UPI0022AF8180|nr:hypothetical protein [Streptomyces sp. H39-C1]MCZ4101006.1 hypothetical protein [Streptomyces sp. H39-C1]